MLGGYEGAVCNYVIETLKSIRKDTVDFIGATSSVTTELTKEQDRILQLLQGGVQSNM